MVHPQKSKLPDGFWGKFLKAKLGGGLQGVWPPSDWLVGGNRVGLQESQAAPFWFHPGWGLSACADLKSPLAMWVGARSSRRTQSCLLD